MIDLLLLDVMSIFAGLYIGEHLKTALQIRLFILCSIVIVAGLSWRWIQARGAYRKALKALKDAERCPDGFKRWP